MSFSEQSQSNDGTQRQEFISMADTRDYQKLWAGIRDDLVRAVESLGFPAGLGEVVAAYLGSPKAMERMIAYLKYVKPRNEELIVDEMLAIRSEIDAWREKKASQKANSRYNEILNYGLTGDESEEDDGFYT